MDQPARNFADKLDAAWRRAGSMMCVGLDPFVPRFPARFQASARPVADFNKFVIDAVGDLVCAFKPQVAHYSAIGAEDQLEETIRYIRTTRPGVLVILDAKRGDIGSTAEMYAREAFDRYDVDAVTVNPYMGDDAVEPFLQRPDRAAIVLCRTSNSSAGQIQDLDVGGRSMAELIAERAERHWNGNSNVMLVVGATSIDDMAALRERAPSIPFLVPGVGEQGGDPAEVVRAGVRQSGDGLVVASSRAILYAGEAPAVRAAAEDLASRLRLAAAAHA